MESGMNGWMGVLMGKLHGQSMVEPSPLPTESSEWSYMIQVFSHYIDKWMDGIKGVSISHFSLSLSPADSLYHAPLHTHTHTDTHTHTSCMSICELFVLSLSYSYHTVPLVLQLHAFGRILAERRVNITYYSCYLPHICGTHASLALRHCITISCLSIHRATDGILLITDRRWDLDFVTLNWSQFRLHTRTKKRLNVWKSRDYSYLKTQGHSFIFTIARPWITRI